MQQHDEKNEVELRDLLAVIRRQRSVVFATFLTVVAAALTVSFVQTPVYEGVVEILLQSNRSEEIFAPDANTFVAADPARVETEIGVMKSLSVRQAVAEELGRPIEVSIEAQGETDLVRLTAESTDPEEAALWANTYAEVYISSRRQQLVDDLQRAITEVQAQLDQIDQQVEQPLEELDAQIEAAETEDQREALEAQREDLVEDVEAREETAEAQRSAYATRLNQLQVAANLTQTGGAQIVSEALVPTSPIRPDPMRNGILAGVLGLVLGVGLAFLRENLDDTLKTKDDLQHAAGGLPVLGLIPAVTGWKDREKPRVVTITEPSSAAAEAYRSLRTSVQFIGLDHTIRALQITSPNASEGKTTTLANLAVALARAGERVIVASCDLRRPRIHEFLGLPDGDPAKMPNDDLLRMADEDLLPLAGAPLRGPSGELGLTSVLLGKAPLADGLHEALRMVPGEGHLALLPTGPTPPNPSEVLSSGRTAELLDLLKSMCDILLVDSPPILPVTDALVLAKMVDATILVGTAGRTTRKEIHRSVELLHQVDAPLVGAVLNGVDPEGTYGYGAGYGYGSASGGAAPNDKSSSPFGSAALNGNGRKHGAKAIVSSALKRGKS